jgi:hypothetical protein
VSLNYQINVDLEVFKLLTSGIQADGQDHNDVLRELLGLDSPLELDNPESPLARAADILGKPFGASGFFSRGLLLPNGTELRARYKGYQYYGAITNDQWIDSDGRSYSSPSAAASAITGTNVNGWRFWEAKRPDDRAWRRLDILGAR